MQQVFLNNKKYGQCQEQRMCGGLCVSKVDLFDMN